MTEITRQKNWGRRRMKMNKLALSLIAVLTAGMMAMPVFADGTAASDTADTSEETAAAEEEESEKEFLTPGRVWEVDTEMEDSSFTIRIKALGREKEGYHWEYYSGDTGGATSIELLTQSTQEKNLVYAGSFRPVTDQKYPFDDSIRLVYTNGIAVEEYMDFHVRIEDGEFEKITGGCQHQPASADYSKQIVGEWKEENGSGAGLKITQNPGGGFDGKLTNAKVKEYDFHAEFDCIKGSFVYKDNEKGLGLFAIDPASEGEDKIRLLMHDMENAGDEDLTFVKAE